MSLRVSHLACLLVLTCGQALAEDGYELWLRYRPEPDAQRRAEYQNLGGQILVPSPTPTLLTARDELQRALSGLRGESPDNADRCDIALVTPADAAAAVGVVAAGELQQFAREGFMLRRGTRADGREVLVVAGGSDVGVLHGVFRLIRELQLGRSVETLDLSDAPRVRERIANHWDNPVRTTSFRSESIERGYAGDSIFRWDELPDQIDPRLHDWARLLAAMGLNGAVINNVNTAKRGLEGWRLLTDPYLPKLAALAEVLRPYGVRLFVSVNFFSPVLIDGYATADPLDPGVEQWWNDKVDAIYATIPDFGGFLVKADSEGEPGPMKYGRTHAEGANMIAAALARHGGALHWRTFVYDRTAGDRVTQAYRIFQPLDGEFAENVFVQIKNGPLDFQVREPVSTLLGAMPRTNQLLELQITQEYTGQDRHVCFLAPMWAEVLQFDTHARGPGSTISRLAQDRLHPEARHGIVGVMNIGSDRNWTGHLLAQANTYAFGRLAWDPDLTPEAIATEWTQLTFGRDPEVNVVVNRILLASWRAFEDYTSPLGLGLLSRRVDHFHPDVANRVDYHGGNASGVGIDRTVATGTGYVGQYFEPWRSRYESIETCPEDLLLFLHHVPYAHRLKNGRTLIQELYDRHFDGVDRARGFLRDWEALRGKIDDERFDHVRERLTAQIAYAEEWCREFNEYFQKLSGIPDEQRRPLP